MKKRVMGAIALSLLLGGCNLSVADVKSLLQEVGIQLKSSDASGTETQFKESDVKEVTLDGKKTSYHFENGKLILPIASGEKHEVKVGLVNGQVINFPLNASAEDFKSGRPDYQVPVIPVADGQYAGTPIKQGEDQGVSLKRNALRIPLKVEGLGKESLLAVYVGRIKLPKDFYFAENGDLLLDPKTAPTIRQVFLNNFDARMKVVYGTPRGPIAVVFVLKSLPPAGAESSVTPFDLSPDSFVRDADEFVGDLSEYEKKQIGTIDPNQTFNPNPQPTPIFVNPVDQNGLGSVRIPLALLTAPLPNNVGAVFVNGFKLPEYARYMKAGDLFLDGKTIETVNKIFDQRERVLLKFGVKIEGNAPNSGANLHRIVVLNFLNRAPMPGISPDGKQISIDVGSLKLVSDQEKDLRNLILDQVLMGLTF